MYHKGDKLVCVDAADGYKLEKDKVYTVAESCPSFPRLEETGEQYDGKRFLKVTGGDNDLFEIKGNCYHKCYKCEKLVGIREEWLDDDYRPYHRGCLPKKEEE